MLNTEVIKIYTYEVWNAELNQFIVSNFNWTTEEAMMEHLCKFPIYNILKFVSMSVKIETLKDWKKNNRHFVSDYVFEKYL